MSCRNLLGLPQRRSIFPDGLETESGIPCIDPGGCGWFGRVAEQSPLTGQLLRTLCGNRDAANAWDEFFNNAAIDEWHGKGRASPRLHFHREQDSHGWKHDDGLVFEGEENWLDELQKGLGRVMILKRRAELGRRASDDKHVTILNKLIVPLVTLEPDPRHLDLLREACGLTAKSRADKTMKRR